MSTTETGPDRDLHKDPEVNAVMNEFHAGCDDETLYLVPEMAAEILRLRDLQQLYDNNLREERAYSEKLRKESELYTKLRKLADRMQEDLDHHTKRHFEFKEYSETLKKTLEAVDNSPNQICQCWVIVSGALTLPRPGEEK